MRMLLLCCLSVFAAATATPPPGYLGPFPQEYSDKQCRNVGNLQSATPAQCAALCDKTVAGPCQRTGGCDAFNYDVSSGGHGGCTLRACDGAHINATSTWPNTVSYRRAGPVPPPAPPPGPPPSWASVGLSGNSHIRGLLNVTAAPLSIDNTGKTDVTTELQAAIVLAHRLGLAVFYPLGTYLVSDTLTAYDPEAWSTGINNTWPCRFSPNVMIGERARPGASSNPQCADGTVGVGCLPLQRPILRLADNAPKFGTKCGGPATAGGSGGSRPVVDFTMTTSDAHPTSVSGINFNQLFKGIDVVIGEGNPLASGVQLPGAQGSSVQDTTITVGSGYAGLVGGAGAGGSHEMVTVIGGRVGVDYSATLNCPTITGATLINQSEAAIIYDGLEAMSVVRLGTPQAVALKVTSANSSKWGEVSIIDSSISAATAGSTAAAPTQRPAFQTDRSLYLRNVFLSGFSAVAESAPVTSSFELNTHGWSQVVELSLGRPIPGTSGGKACPAGINMSLFINGTKTGQPWVSDINSSSIAPPASLTLQHSWDETNFPSLDLGTVIDVRSMGAVGDGSHDDTAAIQKALDTPGAVVLLSKGFYRISKTLNITAGGATSLLGVARHLSVLMPVSDGLVSSATASGAEGSAPILRVSNPSDRIVISMFTIVTWEHLSNTYALDWHNHNHDSVYRQNYFYRITECMYGFGPDGTVSSPVPVPKPNMPCRPLAMLRHPLNVISGSLSAYNFENEDFLYEDPKYRHIAVRDNRPTDKVSFYQANFEHASSEANMEIVNAHNVAIYSFKSEGEWRDLYTAGGTHSPCVSVWIHNSSSIHIFSHGGNARPPKSGTSYPPAFAQYPPSLYRITGGSCDIVLTNLVDQFQFGEFDWNMVYDETGKGTLSPPCDRPVLYTRQC